MPPTSWRKLLQLILGDAPFEIGAGVDARRGVSLEIDEVAAEAVVPGAEEMIEADVVERRGGSEARDMTAQFGRFLVGAQHHRQRIPAHQRPDLVLEFGVPRRALLLGHRNRIHVRRVGVVRDVSAVAARLLDEPARAESWRARAPRARAPNRALRATPAFPAGQHRVGCLSDPWRPPFQSTRAPFAPGVGIIASENCRTRAAIH